ncbi:class F sortase [Geodermatophilus normandii]|uniref:Class F sortase n=1 Tax=Geodermatophilus normandii TaxID=1137989 RepID=A0A6P0GLN3_9ACTN|nr:class F sortase [Geodermatophilus normandii]NEM08258.1 class F sortase [Geodermatophilus normandii]
MRPGRALTLAATVAVLAGCAAPGAAGSAAPSPPPATAVPSTPAPSPAVPGSDAPAVVDPATVPEPVAVSVPAIGVTDELLELGVLADGTAEVPADFDRVGWFTGGGRPGARGPTVLLGHVDSTAGPAVFSDLRDLGPGDVVEVTVADGSVARYEVVGTERFPKDEFPTAAVFGATADDVLRLVTCTGAFDRDARSYVDNLVVTAARTAP